MILRSLTAGVTPARGLRHILVGRRRELGQMLSELKVTSEGGCGCKMVSGDFGSGKTFLLSIIRQLAQERNFVSAQIDFSPHVTLYGAGRGVAAYRALTADLTTRDHERDAVTAMLGRWLVTLEREVRGEQGLSRADATDPALSKAILQRISQALRPIEDLPGGYDFVNVIDAYARGVLQGDEPLMRAGVRWLRGEYATKTEAHRDLGVVRTIVSDDTWYDFLAIWARFVTLLGYTGLLLLFDEGVNLYKLTHAATREKNYEMILRLYNDANQGRLPGLYVVFGTTPESITDERRGLYSYSALKSRLAPNPYETERFKDMSQPVIQLDPLSPEELVVLLQRLRDLHRAHHGTDRHIGDDEVSAFVEAFLNRPGARRFGTARECVRRFLSALNLLQQNPELSTRALFVAEATQADPDDEFVRIG